MVLTTLHVPTKEKISLWLMHISLPKERYFIYLVYFEIIKFFNELKIKCSIFFNNFLKITSTFFFFKRLLREKVFFLSSENRYSCYLIFWAHSKISNKSKRKELSSWSGSIQKTPTVSSIDVEELNIQRENNSCS